MIDALTFAACGVFFVTAAVWMWRHEHWSTTSDRQAWEDRPTTVRRLNYRSSAVLTGVVVPAALVVLGLGAIVRAVGAAL